MKKIGRNLYHLVVGGLFPLGYYFASRPPEESKTGTIIFITVLLILSIVFEVERFRRPGFNKWLFEHLGSFVKSEERFKLTGTAYYVLSSLITISLFSRDIAISALTFLAIGDVVAASVGGRWGRLKIGKKTLEGTLAFFASAFLSGLFLLYIANLNSLTVHAILWGAMTAAIVELIPIPYLDDNLTIPIATAFVLHNVLY